MRARSSWESEPLETYQITTDPLWLRMYLKAEPVVIAYFLMSPESPRMGLKPGARGGVTLWMAAITVTLGRLTMRMMKLGR
jgi:hypothetical protein